MNSEISFKIISTKKVPNSNVRSFKYFKISSRLIAK